MRKKRAFYEIRSDVTCVCKVYTACTNVRIAEIAVGAIESTSNLSVTKVQRQLHQRFRQNLRKKERERCSKTNQMVCHPYYGPLQTATTHMHTLNTSIKLSLFVLFVDSDSQRSYAANHLTKRLGFRPVKNLT